MQYKNINIVLKLNKYSYNLQVIAQRNITGHYDSVYCIVIIL